MKDINSLSGIEFENLCCILLKKVGFDVETTKASGDGGIDLIAYNQKPFFSGKYIIQCKRYAGSVSEPIVRDLYGVVTAERANKGILITTGYFTASAMRFASDKNLELIDGALLNTILSEYELNGSKVVEPTHFSKFDCFDEGRYGFYKEMINQNMCSIDMGHDFLFDFMFGYMERVDTEEPINEMLHAGFAADYLKSFDWYVGKYYSKGKEKTEVLPHYINKYKGIAQLLNFDIFDYVQHRYSLLCGTPTVNVYLSYPYGTYLENRHKMGRSYFTCNLAGLHDKNMIYSGFEEPTVIGCGYNEFRGMIMKNLSNRDKTQLLLEKQEAPFFELLNLLSVFSHFKLQKGVDVINNLLYGNTPEFKDWIVNQQVYQDALHRLRICYSDVQIVEVGKRRVEACANYSGAVELDYYYSMFEDVHGEKIKGEILRVERLLNSFR